MASEKKIRSYCYTFASDRTGLQRDFYSGGNARFADISYAIEAGKPLLILHNKEKLGYPASCGARIYHSETNDLLVFTHCMRQVIAGRVSSCGQVIVYNLKDMLNGDDFMRALFSVRFLSEEEILASTDMRYEDVLRRDPDYAPERRETWSEARKRTLAAVVARLMSGRRVALRLPATRDYEALSLTLLRQIFTLIPRRDRCEFSFATACTETDVKALRGVNLILTDRDEPEDSMADWIELDAPRLLSEAEAKWLRWCDEEPDIRADVENSAHFTDPDMSGGVPRRDLDADREYLEKFYNPANYWWQKQPPEARFRTLQELRKELWENPTLSVKRYRFAFLQPDVLQNVIDVKTELDTPESGFRPSEALREKLRQNKLAVLLYDELYLDKKTGFRLFGGTGGRSSGSVFAQFARELTAPFYASQQEDRIAEESVCGVSCVEIVRELTDRIESYTNL